MSLFQRLMLVTLILCVATAWGQSTSEPHIGYLYPSGGQQGTVIQITVGGQFLKGADAVYVSGAGVRATVVQYIRPPRNLQKEQRELIQQRLKEARDKRLAEVPQKAPRRSRSSARGTAREQAKKPKVARKEEAPKKEAVKLPDHPLLRDLDDKSLRELAHIKEILFFSRSKLQVNRQLAESVLIEVAIDPDAAPGNRELRLKTSAGLTNPVVFQVGRLPEIRELEPNDRQAYPALPDMPKEVTLPKEKPLALPVLLNGQIMPGDVDRFRFRARKGQQLVMETQARSLIPYLADAVPGWFQATLALYDAQGREVAFADDYRFHPDPVLFYRIPADGEYELEIRDSIYRGRADFVYRISVSDRPFITQTFPLGAQAGQDATASVSGWNLPEAHLPLNTQPGADRIGQLAYHKGKRVSNSVPYAVDALPECNETESNDTTKRAQAIDLPKIINGRIAESGDVDVFRFRGRAHDTLVAEVTARRLSSPLDSLLRLTDASGNVLAWNDDHMLKESHLHKDMLGLVTHHADSYLMARLPRTGPYYVQLADVQRHGGAAYSYRLRLSAAQPDFALRVTPSSLYVRAGGIVPICVHVLRKDGFDGAIDMALKEAPEGFVLTGGQIPAGSDRVRLTLKAPNKAPGQPVALQLEGRARIAGKTVTHPAGPADDVMQAFLYRHLVPAQELLVSVRKSRSGMPAVSLAGDGPVRIPAGGSVRVLMETPKRSILKEMRLVLDDPPEGLTLHDVRVVPKGLAFQLQADKDALASGFASNLIVEAFREYTPKSKDGKPSNKKRRYSLGIFPAIPIEIVTP